MCCLSKGEYILIFDIDEYLTKDLIIADSILNKTKIFFLLMMLLEFHIKKNLFIKKIIMV